MSKNTRRADRRQDHDQEAGKRRAFDSYSNPFSRLGFGQPNLIEAAEYPTTRLTQDYALLNSLYRNDWIASRIIDTPVTDMVKNWYQLTSQVQPDRILQLQETERTTHLKQRILEGLKWGRLFGGAAGIIVIDGQEDMMDQPLDLRLVVPGSFKGLIICDRWSGIYPDSGLVQDLSDPDFGLPEYYTFAISETQLAYGVRVHHSRVLRFTGRTLPYIESMAENFWGMSELEHVYTELNKRNTTSSNIAQLVFQANVRTYKMSDFGQLLSATDPRTQRELYTTLAMQNFLQSNMGLNVMDKEDDLVTTQYTFSGISDVYEMFMMDIAGAAEIPVTKLFGRSPAGMNATGESDLTNYYEKISENQEQFLRPVIEKLLPILCLSTWGAIPDDMTFDFEPVGDTTEQERANLIQQSSAAIVSVFQSGLISQKTALKELRQSGAKLDMWTNITDSDIDSADDETSAGMDEMGMEGMLPAGPEMPQETEDDAILTEDFPGQKRNKNGQFGTGKMAGGKTPEKAERKALRESSEGKHKLKKGFSPSNAKKHEKHRLSQYPGMTQKEYERRGIELCEQPVGGDVDGFIDNAGNIVRYRKSTNEFAVGNPNGGLYSFYKPKKDAESGYAYFKKQKAAAEKSLKRGKTR